MIKKMPSCSQETFETFVYLEVESVVVPPLKEQLFKYLKVETAEDDALIEKNIKMLQVSCSCVPSLFEVDCCS